MDGEELQKLRADILEDMKQRLVERANLIQSRYDKVVPTFIALTSTTLVTQLLTMIVK